MTTTVSQAVYEATIAERVEDIENRIFKLRLTAETGEQWADICSLAIEADRLKDMDRAAKAGDANAASMASVDVMFSRMFGGAHR